MMPRLGGFFEAPYSHSNELLDAQNQVINEVMREKNTILIRCRERLLKQLQKIESGIV